MDEELTGGLPDSGNELSLLVIGENTVESYRLPASGDISIGRGEDVAVRIREPWISRRHAIIHVGETLTVEDCGSANGTRVRDVRLKRGETVQVAAGDLIELGSTTLVVSRSRGAPPRRVKSKTYFDERLHEECAAAAKSAGPSRDGFSVVRIRVIDSAHHEQAHTALVGSIRPIDVLATDAPGEYAVLMVRATSLESSAAVARIGHTLRTRGVRVEIGAAACPQDGRDAVTLLETAKARLRAWEPSVGSDSGAILVKDERMLQVHALLARIAGGTANVVLRGESGVGKGVLARRVHGLSAARQGPFLRLDCAALGEELLRKELVTPGRALDAANEGTIYLEEVSELPASLHEDLAKAMGGRAAGIRFISSTQSDLAIEVQRGLFREDLYVRLNGAELEVPPLRERLGELEDLATEFVAHASRDAGRPRAPRIERDALALLRRYSWPGNVRELRNVMARAALLATGDVLGVEHLPREKLGSELAAFGTQLGTEVEEVERRRILSILEQCGGNQSRAAKLLGISRNTLIARLTAYGVARPRGGR